LELVAACGVCRYKQSPLVIRASRKILTVGRSNRETPDNASQALLLLARKLRFSGIQLISTTSVPCVNRVPTFSAKAHAPKPATKRMPLRAAQVACGVV